MSGPCTPWATLADRELFCADCGDLNDDLFETMLDVASGVLFALSGRQYAGACTDTVRPCSRYRWDEPPDWWWWRSAWGSCTCACSQEVGSCGCTRLPQISLGAYPLTTIQSVRIDGELLPATAYAIRDRRWLIRVDGDGFPCCQDLRANPLTDEQTFQVAFTWGIAPPPAGVLASVLLAAEMTRACTPGQECRLPERIQTLSREGVGLALLDPQDFLDKGRTGIYLVDLFLKAANPHGLTRRATVHSPDIPKPVVRIDTTPGS